MRSDCEGQFDAREGERKRESVFECSFFSCITDMAERRNKERLKIKVKK